VSTPIHLPSGTDARATSNVKLPGLDSAPPRDPSWEREMERAQLASWFRPQEFAHAPRVPDMPLASAALVRVNNSAPLRLTVDGAGAAAAPDSTAGSTMQRNQGSRPSAIALEKQIEGAATRSNRIATPPAIDGDRGLPGSYAKQSRCIDETSAQGLHDPEQPLLAERSASSPYALTVYQAARADTAALAAMNASTGATDVVASADEATPIARAEEQIIAPSVPKPRTALLSASTPGPADFDIAQSETMPWRLHLEAGASGHIAWIAMRQTAPNWQAALPAITTELVRTLAAQGKTLTTVICNGQPVWQANGRATWVVTDKSHRSFHQIFEEH
jgi:hypothetical protein